MSQISGFDKLNPSQPLQPLDWNFLAKAKELQQAKQFKLLDLASSAEDNLPVSGGYATKDAAKEYTAKTINPALNSYMERITKGNEDPLKVYGELRQAVSKIQNDPTYQKIKADELYKPEVDKNLKDPLFDQHVQDYYDPNNGFGQVSLADIQAGKFNPPTYYKGIAPSPQIDDFKPFYDKVVAKETAQWANNPDYTEEYDANGNLIIRSVLTGDRVKEITPDMIRAAGERMIYDPNSGFMNMPSMRYLAAKLNKETEGSANPLDAASRAFVNTYTGYFQNKYESQPKTNQQIVKASKDGTSNSGNKTDESTLSENPITRALETANYEGTSTLQDLDAYASLMNGSGVDDKEGTFKVNLAGTPTFIKVSPNTVAVNPDTQKNSLIIGYYAKYKDLINKIEASVPSVDRSAMMSAGDPTDPSAVRLVNEAEKERKTLIEEKTRSNSRLQGLIAQAKENRIDLTDPETVTQVETLAKDPDMALAMELTIALQDVKSTVNFRPLREGNIGTVDSGDFTADGVAEISRADLIGLLTKNGEVKDALDKIDAAKELGLISVGSVEESKPGSPSAEKTYYVPISKIIGTDPTASTERFYAYHKNPELRKEVTPQTKIATQFASTLRDKKYSNAEVNNFLRKDINGKDRSQEFESNLQSKLELLRPSDPEFADGAIQNYYRMKKIYDEASTPGEKQKALDGISSIIKHTEEALKEAKVPSDQIYKPGTRPAYSNQKPPAYYE